MRLTHIKLAGFKSFVDSTHIVVPGALVGVVGPNGCGKSNVIDAVRWVLGESRAAALRGEVMQDVIFNGSGTRKPVSRASVELIFDNRLQQAAGPWSAYPEISIKRVLLRDSESAYYINNQHVRRRDVADIFLGTGLGGRGYAIIEQGMISRVVEAKPEDLRVYLEEAAGVSRYRERRRETEVKLADARHNLNRVEDILRELAEQLVKLKEQARLAERYHELQRQAQTTQHLIWFMRKREAQAARERAQREEARVQNELDAETAKLRRAELEIEALRDRNHERNDALSARQGAFYQASAEVAQLEQALQHLRDNRRRLETQVHNLRAQLAQQQEQRNSAAAELEHWQAELAKAGAEVAAAAEAENAETSALPQAEAQWRASRDRVDEKLRAVSEARERLNVEETHRDHATRAIEQLGLREQRLAREQQQLVVPDPAQVEALRQELAAAEKRLIESRAKLAAAEQRLPERERERSRTLTQLDQERSELTAHHARCDALEALQSKLKRDETLNAWVSERGLGALPRLWQAIGIEPGWEDALEAVLRERLNGIAIGRQNGLIEGEAPPRRLALFELANGIRSEEQDAAASDRPWRPLRDYVLLKDPAVASALDDWLVGVYAVADRGAAQAGRSALPAGACLVCPEGHVFTRHTVSFYAPDSALHGVISRQREIEELQERIDALRAGLENTTAVFNQADAGLTACRAELSACSSRCAAEQQGVHELQVAALKAAQELDGAQERERQLEHGLADLFSQMQHQTVLRQAAESRAAGLKTTLGQLQGELEQTSCSCEAAEASYKAGRDRLERAREKLSSARFQRTLCEQRIKDISERVHVCDESCRELADALEKLLEEQAGLDEGALVEALGEKVGVRRDAEQALHAARDALEELSALQRTEDTKRLESEQKLGPLRDAVNEARLKEQEARLNEQQYDEQLGAAGADELASLLQKGMRVNQLQSELGKLKEEIDGVGAVNLAAFEELKAAEEREAYLRSQADDLTQAAATLENAIARIDREARERLQATFDQVNRHLAELFPALFGGGEAKLEMTGNDVLSTGVSIAARPPGKKNTSIHLLSGGEKALTALALVFAMFKLNPAPFCLLDEVDAPLDEANTERFCELVRKMSEHTQFLFITHNRLTMELAQQLIGVTMAEQGVSRVVAVDVEQAMRMKEEAVA